MRGWQVGVLWILVALCVAFAAEFSAAVAWADVHSGFAAWVQAVGSVLAIVLAVWVVDRQHRLELLRNSREKHEARVAVRNGVVQLIGSVEAIARKVYKHCTGAAVQAPQLDLPAGQLGQPTILGLVVLTIELETAINAVSRVDHMILGEHALIEGVQVAESSGKLLLRLIQEQLNHTQNPKEFQWYVPVEAAQLCEKSIKQKADLIHQETGVLAASLPTV